jgi:hypothetical protein
MDVFATGDRDPTVMASWPTGHSGYACYRHGVRTIPLDEGPRTRRRIGPFWIEEGIGLVAAGALILLVVTVLYILAVVNRPT